MNDGQGTTIKILGLQALLMALAVPFFLKGVIIVRQGKETERAFRRAKELAEKTGEERE